MPPSGARLRLSAGDSRADATGGLAITPSDPRVGFRELGAQLAGAYELGIEPLPSDRDGAPHRITVRVRGRGGVTVRARRQFVLPALTTTAPLAAPAEPPSAGRSRRTRST